MADIEWPLDAIPEGQEFSLEWATSRTESPFTRQQQVMGRPGAERWRTKMSVVRYDQGSALALDAFLSSLKGGIQHVLVPDFRRLRPAGAEYETMQDWIDRNHPSPVEMYFDSGARFGIGDPLGGLLTEDARQLVTEAVEPLAYEGFDDVTGALLLESGDALVAEDDAPLVAELWETPVFVSEAWEADIPEPVLVSGAGSTVEIAGVAPDAVVFVAGDLIQTSPGRVHEVAEDALSDAFGVAVVTVRPRLRLPAVPGPLPFPARARMRIDTSAAARNPTRAPVISSYEIELTEDLNI